MYVRLLITNQLNINPNKLCARSEIFKLRKVKKVATNLVVENCPTTKGTLPKIKAYKRGPLIDLYLNKQIKEQKAFHGD